MKAVFAALLAVGLAVGLASADEKSEKGSFGVVINQNFVFFSYVLTYIGDSETAEGHVAFFLEFKDNKGYDIPNEVDDTETYLKIGVKKITGKAERKSSESVMLLFPLEDGQKLKGRVTVYTRIFDSKLKKRFRF
ncbi:MAG: hypothetical protein FVQ81_01770 [Candidatus Glassbacteria bacterium]|nr:hypothetical protein [Candidatus Glassbacteria bacterium]